MAPRTESGAVPIRSEKVVGLQEVGYANGRAPSLTQSCDVSRDRRDQGLLRSYHVAEANLGLILLTLRMISLIDALVGTDLVRNNLSTIVFQLDAIIVILLEGGG
jgi:hypothetical protein